MCKVAGHIPQRTKTARWSTWPRPVRPRMLFGLCSHARLMDGLAVSFIHSEHFPFPLKPVSLVKLQSNNVPTALVEAKRVESGQIFVSPLLMRHIMPLIMQDDELIVSIPERDGPVHDYTFSMQPNDIALKPIRTRCFDF